MRLRILLLALAVPSLIAAAACDEKLSDLAGPTPNLEPSFASIQREIFQTTDSSGRVLCTGCHTNVGRTPAGGLNLLPDFAHSQLVNVPSRDKPGAIRVIPGDPENSYLIHKLEGRPGIVGLRMPRTAGPYLTEGQMMILKRWIAQGARND
jgi:hypothetical protein